MIKKRSLLESGVPEADDEPKLKFLRATPRVRIVPHVPLLSAILRQAWLVSPNPLADPVFNGTFCPQLLVSWLHDLEHELHKALLLENHKPA